MGRRAISKNFTFSLNFLNSRVFYQTMGSAMRKYFFASSRAQFLLAAAVLAFCTRLVMVLAVGETHSPPAFLCEQGEIARNIYRGHGYSFHAHYIYTSLMPERQAIMQEPPQFLTANQPPLFTYVFYGIFSIFGDTPAALMAEMLLNCCLAALMPLLLYRIAIAFAGDAEARLSVLCFILYLPGAHSAAKHLGAVLTFAVALFAVYALVRTVQQKTLLSALLFGISLGVWALIRSEAMLLGVVLIFLVALLHVRQESMRNVLVQSGIALVAMMLVLAPWTYRNYHLFGRVMPTVSRAWHEIWKGNNPLFQGSLYRGSGKEIEQVFAGDTLINRRICMRLDSIPYNQAFEPRQDDIFKEEAIAYVKAHPVKTLAMTMLKAVELWTFDFFYEKTRHPAYILMTLPFTLLAALGLIVAYKHRGTTSTAPLFWCFACIYAYYTAIFGVTFLMVRYQVYFVSLLLPFTGLGVWRLLPHRFK